MTVSCAESQIAEYAASYSSPSLSYIWARIKDHKVAQWTLAYAAAAYTLLHIVEMVSEALDWPHLIPRIVTLSLFLGAPVAATIAWYHGHKTRHRVSGAERSSFDPTAPRPIAPRAAGETPWAVRRTGGARCARRDATAPHGARRRRE